jgi:tight adherence protein B
MNPLVLIGAAVVVAIVGAVALIGALTRPPGRLVAGHPSPDQAATPAQVNYEPRADTAPLLTRLLRRTPLNDLLQWELLRAGLLIKPSEMLVVSLAAGLALFIVGLLFTPNLVTRGVLVCLGLAGPWVLVAVRKQSRYKLLVTQLPEALQLVASSLRSGFSILRAIEVVAEEMPPPICQEFRWVLDEVNVGVSMEKAFGHMTARTNSPDVKLMVTAIQIQSNVGGDLAEVLEATSAMIRERFQLTAEIAALTAEGRLSAIILGGLPIGLALLIHMLNPEYMVPLVTEPMGIAMVVVGGTMMLLGVLIIKSMLNVDI